MTPAAAQDACEHFQPSSLNAAICAVCERHERDHEVCEYFEQAETQNAEADAARAALLRLAIYCDNCGRSEADHDVCSHYAPGTAEGGPCETCGRRKEAHTACREYDSDGESACTNCGKGPAEHSWMVTLRDQLAKSTRRPRATNVPLRRPADTAAAADRAIVGSVAASYRHNSYSDVRQCTWAQWFVDGCEYFAAVADAMETAQRSIYISTRPREASVTAVASDARTAAHALWLGGNIVPPWRRRQLVSFANDLYATWWSA